MKPKRKWSWFRIASGREPIATLDALADFLVRESSLVAQKSIVDYCHMKTRLPLNELMREKAFTDAFEAARGAALSAVLGDLLAAVEAHLRAPAGAKAGLLPKALAVLYRQCRARFAAGAAGEAAAEAAALERRLARLQLAEPKSSAEIALTSGNIVFDSLPLHPSLRKFDREPVVEGVRFLLMSRCQRLDERLAAGALVEALFAASQAAPA